MNRDPRIGWHDHVDLIGFFVFGILAFGCLLALTKYEDREQINQPDNQCVTDSGE
jgi:hypothetical protein